MNWPERGDEPVNERSSSFLFGSSYPTLFPCATGDQTVKFRRTTEVSLYDWLKHLIKYYDPNRQCYPFAQHSRFCHYAHDMDERHRIQSQCSIFMQNNPEEANMTIQDLRVKVQDRDNSKMQRYAANIRGSSSYFAFHKKQLLALQEQLGIATAWFSLSMPNWLWKDLQNILGPPPQST